jgi:hypothetical protein
MESEMYEGKWSCMHNNQQGLQLITLFKISRRIIMICSWISGWREERDSRNKEENKTNYTTTILKEKSYSLSVSKGRYCNNCVSLILIDQQYLQNDIIMEKLIQTLFLMTMQNKQQKTKLNKPKWQEKSKTKIYTTVIFTKNRVSDQAGPT